jgi:hypothetical protein
MAFVESFRGEHFHEEEIFAVFLHLQQAVEREETDLIGGDGHREEGKGACSDGNTGKAFPESRKS